MFGIQSVSLWRTRRMKLAKPSTDSAHDVDPFIDRQADLRGQFLREVRAVERARCAARAAGQMEWSPDWPTLNVARYAELRCGARSKRTGKPCPQRGIYSNSRCRWHGGPSTGPRTAAGKARSAQNAVRNEPHERGKLEISVPPREAVEKAEPRPDRNLTPSSMPPDSAQRRVLEWLSRRAWRPSPEAQLSQALSLAPVKLRWVLRCLQRRGFVTDVRGADGDGVAWQVLRNRL